MVSCYCKWEIIQERERNRAKNEDINTYYQAAIHLQEGERVFDILYLLGRVRWVYRGVNVGWSCWQQLNPALINYCSEGVQPLHLHSVCCHIINYKLHEEAEDGEGEGEEKEK